MVAARTSRLKVPFILTSENMHGWGCVIQKMHEKSSHSVVEPVASSLPYGRALNTLRKKHIHSIKRYFMHFTSVECSYDQPPKTEAVKTVFKQLCKQRAAKRLQAGADWFAFHVTLFEDQNLGPFVNFIRNYWSKSQLLMRERQR